MLKIFEPLGIPLGWLMYVINEVVHNYGITLIIFAIIFKALMIPLGIKQQKAMVVNARIQPKMAELQKKYANNRQKLAEEMQALYAKEHFSPYSSCLPLLVQFPILMGMLDVVYYPIKHLVRLPSEVITKAISIATPIMGEQFMMKSYSKEICVLSAINQNPAPFFEGLGEAHASAIANFDFSMFGLFLGDMPTLTPAGKPWGLYFALLLIPILSGITSLWMSKVTQASAPQSGDAAAAGMNRSMMLMMPLMSVWISFVVPAGVGIYWLISNVLSAIQSIVLNKYMNPVEEAKKAAAEAEERYQQERQEKIEAKKTAREQRAQGIYVEKEEGLSQKEQNRRKLAEARRRDAEKYGEEYHED